MLASDFFLREGQPPRGYLLWAGTQRHKKWQKADPSQGWHSSGRFSVKVASFIFTGRRFAFTASFMPYPPRNEYILAPNGPPYPMHSHGGHGSVFIRRGFLFYSFKRKVRKALPMTTSLPHYVFPYNAPPLYFLRSLCGVLRGVMAKERQN